MDQLDMTVANQHGVLQWHTVQHVNVVVLALTKAMLLALAYAAIWTDSMVVAAFGFAVSPFSG